MTEELNIAIDKQNIKYKDLDQLTYDDNTLRFLRKKLDDFTIDVFKKIVRENKNRRGLVKTRISDYRSMRYKYDSAFLTLEAQGFIERREDGTSTPYFATVRGRQLVALLKLEESERKDVGVND
jgi:predicted DNA binding CopG/RHH family protein